MARKTIKRSRRLYSKMDKRKRKTKGKMKRKNKTKHGRKLRKTSEKILVGGGPANCAAGMTEASLGERLKSLFTVLQNGKEHGKKNEYVNINKNYDVNYDTHMENLLNIFQELCSEWNDGADPSPVKQKYSRRMQGAPNNVSLSDNDILNRAVQKLDDGTF